MSHARRITTTAAGTGLAVILAGAAAETTGHDGVALGCQIVAGALILPVIVAGVWNETKPPAAAAPPALPAARPRLALPAAPPRRLPSPRPRR